MLLAWNYPPPPPTNKPNILYETLVPVLVVVVKKKPPSYRCSVSWPVGGHVHMWATTNCIMLGWGMPHPPMVAIIYHPLSNYDHHR